MGARAGGDRGSEAAVDEVFVSVQGEGRWVGERQVFVRLSGCGLDCAYCDSQRARRLVGECLVHHREGGPPAVIPNPVGVEALTDVVMALEGPRRLHSIAVTGGEPLLQHAFLRRWLPVAQQRGYRAYLETAGIHRERLSAIIDHTDFCSMDVKLPSTSGLRSYLDRHRDFLCACRDAAIPTQAKAVVGARTPRDEIAECAGMVGATWPDAVLVLQPATPTARQSDVPSPAHLLELQSVALRYVERVLVIPQTHRLVGLQ